jgi:AMP nucleosidase
LLVSDQPMIHGGIKTAKSDQKVTRKYLELHLRIGIDSLKELINKGETVKHLRF